MKKFIYLPVLACALSVFLFSCNNGSENNTENKHAEETTPTTNQETPAADTDNSAAKIAEGKALYEKQCQACHQADGKGLPAAFPPLASSDYLAADLHRAIGGVVNGLSGEITVNGAKFNQTMPKSTYTDEEIAAVFTYVLNSFGNKGGTVTAEEVKALRK